MLAAAGCGGGGTDTGVTPGSTQDPAVTAVARSSNHHHGQLQQIQTALLNNGGNFGDAAAGNRTTAQITASPALPNRITVTVELDAESEQITFVDRTSGPANGHSPKPSRKPCVNGCSTSPHNSITVAAAEDSACPKPGPGPSRS